MYFFFVVVCTFALVTSVHVDIVTQYAWPGKNNVSYGDYYKEFEENISGAQYISSNEMWVVKNEPAMLYHLIHNNLANVWEIYYNPISIFYPDGTSNPDAEDIAITNEEGVLYVSVEESNVDKISQPGVLRYNVMTISNETYSLTATHFWDLTYLLPHSEANKGLEAISWINDSYLCKNKFYDEYTNSLYNPKQYPDHGEGLFFVGLEDNGYIYAVSLMGMKYKNVSATIVQRIKGEFNTIMSLEFDMMTGYLWGGCDNHCDGIMTIYNISLYGRVDAIAIVYPPKELSTSMNIEGFAINNYLEHFSTSKYKNVTWTDDACTNGHALYEGTIPIDNFIT